MKTRFTIRVPGAVSFALAFTTLAAMMMVSSSTQAQTFKSLYSFADSPDGAAPYGGVIKDKSGNLYGTTSVGGTSGSGTVYKLDKNGKDSVLYSFTGGIVYMVTP